MFPKQKGLNKYIRAKSLRDLGVKQIYNIPPLEEASSIQQRIIKLYNTVIEEYSLGDIRFMIGQNLGIDFLINIAFDHLKENIFLDSEYYEGDLLSIILRIPSEFWKMHPTEKDKFLEILSTNYNIIIDQDLSLETNRKIKKLAKEFIEKYSD